MGSTAINLAAGMSPGGGAASQPGSKPMAGQGEERTPAAPKPEAPKDASGELQQANLDETEKKALLEIIRRYTDAWDPVRRKRVRQVLKAREYDKGNHYISFDPNTFTWYDPMEVFYSGKAEDEDLGVYRYTNNLYQSLKLGFVAALSPDVPKSRYTPADAERFEDVATAKAGSTMQEIIERQNKIRTLLRDELGLLWTDGSYWKYTRFALDENSPAGVRKLPVVEIQSVNIPDAYLCPNCDHETPGDAMSMLEQPVCEACGQPLTDMDYFPGGPVPSPVITKIEEVPNGMVKQTVYGMLNIIVAPYANEVAQTPILRLDEEVDIASIRSSYPDSWKDIQNTTSGQTEGDRIARQYVMNAVGGRNNLTAQMMPTLSRTWIQNFAFAMLDDQTMAQQLQQKFPKGILVVHQGERVLEAREEKLTEKWNWCPAMRGYGQYPPAVGDVALEVQDQINDGRNIIMEYIDRCASPEEVVNESAIDTRKLNGKPRLPGGLLPVKVKGGEQGRALSDFFHTPKLNLAPEVIEYVDMLTVWAQLLSGVMPQIFGGNQEHVDTYGGQKQALNVALGKLGLYWEAIREEHAISAGLGVRCAAANYSEDVLDVVGGGNEDFRNRYVSLDDLQGNFHAQVETDQGFPMTWAEQRDRIEVLFTQQGGSEWLLALLDEPTNQKIFATYMLPSNIVLPGQATRDKTLRVINQLLEMTPTTQLVPNPAGQPVLMTVPSIQPDPDFDDMQVVQKVIRQWGEEHYDLQYENPVGFENVRAYLRMAMELEMMQIAQQTAKTVAGGVPPDSGGGGASGGGAKPAPKTPAAK